MICSMKIISVGFDLDESDRKKESNPESKDLKPEPAPGDKKNRDKSGVKSRTEKKNGMKTEPVAEKKELVNEGLISLPGWFEFAGKIIIVELTDYADRTKLFLFLYNYLPISTLFPTRLLLCNRHCEYEITYRVSHET